MPNVKPGDMCIILGTNNTPLLNGRIVEVVRQAFTLDAFNIVGGGVTQVNVRSDSIAWEVKSNEALPWNTKNGLLLHETIPVNDMRLFKIKDKDVDMETETIKELELEKV